MLRWLTALLAVLVLSASVASAQDSGTTPFDPCANPQYAQLLSYNFSDDVIGALRTQDVEIHFIDSLFFDYGQEYHYDWYTVTLNMPESLSAETLLSEMVAHPNHAVQSIIFDALGEFTPRRPESNSPRVGDIYDIDVLGLEDGSVMLTELASDHYIFTTLTTDETGSHPTPGARVWGFTRDNASGDVTFYTRGVSRTDVPDPGIGEFAQSEFWEAMFEGIADRVVDEGGTLIAPLQSQTWDVDPDNQPSCAIVVEEWNFTWANERIDCGSSYIIYYDFTTTVTTTDNGQSLTRLAIGGAEAQFERSGDQSYVLVNREYNDLDAVVQSETLRYESVSLIVGERTDYFPNLNCSVTNPYRMEFVRGIVTGGSPDTDCIPDKETDCAEQQGAQIGDWNFAWQNQTMNCSSGVITYYDFITTVSTVDDGQRLTRLAIGGAEAQFQSSGAQSYVLVNTQYNDLDAVVQAESLRYESPTVIVGERTDYFSEPNCSVTNPYRMELVRTYEEGSGPGQTCIIIATQTVNLRSGPGPNTDSAGQLQSGQSLRVGRQARGDDGFTWFQSTENATWIRADIVFAMPICQNLPN